MMRRRRIVAISTVLYAAAIVVAFQESGIRQKQPQFASSTSSGTRSSCLDVLPKHLFQKLEPIQSSKLQDFLRKSRPGGSGYQKASKTKLTTTASAFSIPPPQSPTSGYFQPLPLHSLDNRFGNGSSGSRTTSLNLSSYFSNSEGEDGQECKRAKIDELRNVLATDVTTLRSLFGENRNKLWGDLDNETARKLYHTLLPRVLLRVQETKDCYSEITPDELAHLAYQARVAAKEYARERCNVPGRIFAMAYDGFRHLKQYGKWSAKGMSWDEVWEKYSREIQEEILYSVHHEPDSASEFASLKLEDLTKQVCLRILERSCKTNTTIDRLFMKDGFEVVEGSSVAADVLLIARQFDQEINELIECSLCKENNNAKIDGVIIFQNIIIPFNSDSAKKTARKWSIVTKKNIRHFEKEFRGNDMIHLASRQRSKIWRSV